MATSLASSSMTSSLGTPASRAMLVLIGDAPNPKNAVPGGRGFVMPSRKTLPSSKTQVGAGLGQFEVVGAGFERGEGGGGSHGAPHEHHTGQRLVAEEQPADIAVGGTDRRSRPREVVEDLDPEPHAEMRSKGESMRPASRSRTVSGTRPSLTAAASADPYARTPPGISMSTPARAERTVSAPAIQSVATNPSKPHSPRRMSSRSHCCSVQSGPRRSTRSCDRPRASDAG